MHLSGTLAALVHPWSSFIGPLENGALKIPHVSETGVLELLRKGRQAITDGTAGQDGPVFRDLVLRHFRRADTRT